MAIFDLSNPEQFNQLDWKILRIGAVSLYIDSTILEADCIWFREQNYREYQFDGITWLTRKDFYADINKQLTPPYYCENLQYLQEFLVDQDVPYESGTILVFRRFDVFANLFVKDAYQILDIMENISRCFLLTGQRFIVLVQSNNPTLVFDPVGARPIVLNPTEKVRRMRLALKEQVPPEDF